MNSQQFKALAHTESGRLLTGYVRDLIQEITDIRKIEEITETEVTARRRAAEILEESLLNRLETSGKDHKREEPTEFE